MKFLSIGFLLALSGLAAAGNLHHGGASSYTTVVQHGGSYGHGGSGHGWSGHGDASYGHGGAGYGHGGAGGASSYASVVKHDDSHGHGVESGHGWSGHGDASYSHGGAGHGWSGHGDASYSHGGAGYGHGGAGGASSYASVVKHDDSHGHGVESGHGWSGHGYASYGHGGSGYSHGGAGHDYGHDYHSYPQYEFSYGVKDSKTGDMKDQWEHRDGDHVKGSYTLKEADGTTRVVDYHADGHHGFNAIVKKLGHAHHPETYHHHGNYAGHGYGHATIYAKVKVH
ncbi:uncharacterized protein LOC133333557 [Musca vetustissima]|uniref:uncharacterized protein LOC133333557 n=1 Tax=Musca vetustissima TaxID=27455 RepID=UPI002AB5E3A4|nr:uncharacterized protein LOC133333557 [Musca vetustissima]